ncbi:MAG: PilN domain-containing protein [Rhodothermales bacterium]
MANKRSSDLVLGVMVTNRMLHAVLLQGEGDSVRVLRRFTRQRVTKGAQAGLMTSVPELQEDAASGGDFTIQFGDGTGGGGNLFLNSEFGSGDASGLMDSEDEMPGGISSTFVLELGDILAECKDTGYEDPIVAFCADSSDVMHVELRSALADRKDKKDEEDGASFRVSTNDRSWLLKVLAEQYQGGFEANRVGFLKMNSLDPGELRYLAVFPKQRDSVIATLLAMREQQNSRLPTVRILDAEVPLYLGLARSALATSTVQTPPERTHSLIVRAGTEDTLVLFMRGSQLLHYESLRSLTAYESPETICSRVLLQQDEHGINEVQHVFLLSEEREEELVESFEMFFPDSNVSSLRHIVYDLGDLGLEEANTSAIVGAVASALRLLPDERFNGVFDEINLMPNRLIKRRFKIPITWHIPVIGLLIMLTGLFFVYKYISVDKEIETLQQKLAGYPPEILNADSRVLQARIDSFNTVTASYLNALTVLDGLLKGSDQWSRTLEKVAEGTAGVRGIWIDNWRPEQDQLVLIGTSSARDRVVQLAEMLDGDIESLTYSEIREAPVFSFRMRIPLIIELPEAAIYLRNQVEGVGTTPDESEQETAAQPGIPNP